jgi:ribosomal protein S18 acetylase RimI-like enzyme
MRDEIAVRWAVPLDLEFVSQDGGLPLVTVARKVEAGGEVAVAELEGDRAGFLRLEYLWGRLPYIALIHVPPPLRRRGIGRTLLAFVASELRGRGHTALYSSSRVDEPESQTWYRHMGFAECGILAGVNRGGVGEVFFSKWL